MRFMNDFEIDGTVRRFVDHPVLGPATRTIANLRDWANANSDGWAYWPKPARAAAKLMELIEGDGTWEAIRTADERVTPAAYRKALAPIKAFRTRQGADFEIVEAVSV
jgi:hypothetical protein